jgi:hypothetical protein
MADSRTHLTPPNTEKSWCEFKLEEQLQKKLYTSPDQRTTELSIRSSMEHEEPQKHDIAFRVAPRLLTDPEDDGLVACAGLKLMPAVKEAIAQKRFSALSFSSLNTLKHAFSLEDILKENLPLLKLSIFFEPG